jgi:cytochrome P450
MARTNIPGPGRIETLRGLLPVPFRRFPTFLRETARRYGNVVAFSLPWRSYVFVNEPAIVKEILVTQQHAFSKSLGTRVLRLLLGDGLLTSEDPLHRTMRRIVQPAFHRERLVEYARIMERDADEFAAGLDPVREFDAHAAMTALTLRIATETLFGSDESDSAELVGDALRLMMNEFPAMLTPLGALRQRLPLANTRRFWRAHRMLDAIIYGLIARRRSEKGERHDALSLLLAAADDELCHPERSEPGERSRRAGDEQVRDEIMTLFMAGHETTANLMTWTLYLLAQHPEADERAYAAAHHGDRGYLDRVLKEVLRLYPPAWIIGREALRDVEFANGMIVPAKTTVFLAPLILHRRPEYFAQAERFEPDRWLDFEPAPFAYVPFGGGARRCIGEEFAMREAAIVLAAIVRRFRFTLAANARVGIAPLVTLRPAGPVMLRPSARGAEESSAAS